MFALFLTNSDSFELSFIFTSLFVVNKICLVQRTKLFLQAFLKNLVEGQILFFYFFLQLWSLVLETYHCCNHHLKRGNQFYQYKHIESALSKYMHLFFYICTSFHQFGTIFLQNNSEKLCFTNRKLLSNDYYKLGPYQTQTVSRDVKIKKLGLAGDDNLDFFLIMALV